MKINKSYLLNTILEELRATLSEQQDDEYKLQQTLSVPLEKGQTISGLAKQYDISTAELLKLNNITPEQARRLPVGKQIKIPASPSDDPEAMNFAPVDVGAEAERQEREAEKTKEMYGSAKPGDTAAVETPTEPPMSPEREKELVQSFAKARTFTNKSEEVVQLKSQVMDILNRFDVEMPSEYAFISGNLKSIEQVYDASILRGAQMITAWGPQLREPMIEFLTETIIEYSDEQRAKEEDYPIGKAVAYFIERIYKSMNRDWNREWRKWTPGSRAYRRRQSDLRQKRLAFALPPRKI